MQYANASSPTDVTAFATRLRSPAQYWNAESPMTNSPFIVRSLRPPMLVPVNSTPDTTHLSPWKWRTASSVAADSSPVYPVTVTDTGSTSSTTSDREPSGTPDGCTDQSPMEVIPARSP